MKRLDRRSALKVFGLGLISAGTGAPFFRYRAESAPRDRDRHASADSRGIDSDEGKAASRKPENGPAPWWLLAPFTAGSRVRQCRLVRITPPDRGAVTVKLDKPNGDGFSVRICRRDCAPSAPAPIARSALYDFFLPNGGKGQKPTDEQEGLAAMAIAAMAQRNEANRPVLPLLTLRQYWQRTS